MHFTLSGNALSYVACGLENAGLPVRVAVEPNFIILFLHFCDKAKLENLALDGDGKIFRQPKPPACYIGVVISCYFLMILFFLNIQYHMGHTCNNYDMS